MTESSAAELFDFRTGSNIRPAMTALLRHSIYSRLAGYEDVNDAKRLRVDPVMRHIVGGRAVDRDAASTSQVARSETDVLCHPDNLDALMAMPGRWVDRVRQRRPTDKLILDVDSSVSPTYGQQERTAYNGHFGRECYHPLPLFNQDGHLERALLRFRIPALWAVGLGILLIGGCAAPPQGLRVCPGKATVAERLHRDDDEHRKDDAVQKRAAAETV